MKLERDRFIDAEGQPFNKKGLSNGKVFYDQFQLGKIRNRRGYDFHLESTDGKWRGSFPSKWEGLEELYYRATRSAIPLSEIFPSKYYILRVNQADILYSPDPKVKPLIRCRVHFNVMTVKGNSVQSRPARFSTASFDPKTKVWNFTKLPKDWEKFENLDDIQSLLECNLKEGLARVYS